MCPHLRSLHVTSRATDLEHACFLEAVLPENCGPTLSVWQPQHSFGFVRIQTANISALCWNLACLGFAYRVHYNSDLPLFEMKQDPIHEATSVMRMWPPRVQLTVTLRQEFITRVWWNYTAETLCEGIILQKRFVKKSKWNIRSIEEKMFNINFLSNIF
jgi:hypothetical protein